MTFGASPARPAVARISLQRHDAANVIEIQAWEIFE
jgi:hypothetical protein